MSTSSKIHLATTQEEFNSYLFSQPDSPRRSDESSLPADASRLQGRKIVPGFGDSAGVGAHISWTLVAAAVASVQLAVFAACCAGYLIAGSIGVSVGVIGVSSLACATAVGMVFYKRYYSLRYQRILAEGQKELVVPHESCRLNAAQALGHYVKADVRITENAEESFAWKIRAIKSAEQSVEISANFAGGESFQELLDVLERQMLMKPHLKVHLLLSSDLLEHEDRLKLEKLTSTYGDRFCSIISPRILAICPTPHTEENHVKLVVVDGRYFIAGGTSIHPQLCREEHSLPEHHDHLISPAVLLDKSSRDMDVVGRSDEMGAILREQFFRLLQIWEMRSSNCEAKSRYFNISNMAYEENDFFEGSASYHQDVKMKLFVSGPEHNENGNPITQAYVKLIRKARSEIRFASLLLNPGKDISAALSDVRAKEVENEEPHGEKGAAKKKRMKIKAYVNGPENSFRISRVLLRLLSRPFYSLFDRIYEYDKPNQIYHKKVMIVDETYSVIGSYNLGAKSRAWDHELSFVIKDRRVAKDFNTILKEDKRRSSTLRRDRLAYTHITDRIHRIFSIPFIENFI